MKTKLACALAASTAAVLFAPRASAQQDTGGTTAPVAAGGDASGSAGSANASASVTVSDPITNVLEDKGKGYYFLGVNYRVNLIPAFIINLFVDQGPNLVGTSTVGLSFDYRKDHFSIIPGVNFSDYTLSPILFLQKGKDPSDPGDWGVVQSNLKAIYATVDLLWSVPLLKTGQVDFRVRLRRRSRRRLRRSLQHVGLEHGPGRPAIPEPHQRQRSVLPVHATGARRWRRDG